MTLVRDPLLRPATFRTSAPPAYHTVAASTALLLCVLLAVWLPHRPRPIDAHAALPAPPPLKEVAGLYRPALRPAIGGVEWSLTAVLRPHASTRTSVAPINAAAGHPSSPIFATRAASMCVFAVYVVAVGYTLRPLLGSSRTSSSFCVRRPVALRTLRHEGDVRLGEPREARPKSEINGKKAVDIPTEEEEFEELEILPVVDEEYSDEAFVLDYNAESNRAPITRPLKDQSACERLAAARSRASQLRWVNVTGNEHSLTKPILTAFGIHPLFVEDILHDAERAKVENLGDGELVVLFQTVQLMEEDDDEEGIPLLRLEMNQVSLVLKGNVLLSFFNSPSKTVEQCKETIAFNSSKFRSSSSHWLVHMIMDKEVDRLFPIMNRFRRQLEEVQQQLESKRPRGLVANPNASNARLLQVLQTTSQEMNNLLFVLRPLASTVAALTEYTKQRSMTELQWHFDDLRDHIATILDYVSSLQTWVKNLKDDYSYIQQENMNRTMYTLTLITALFVPAQFLTGLFGMNFEYMPWLEWEYGFEAFWGVVLAVGSFSVLLFKRIRWL
eukprot:EG_transcript_4935